MDFPNLTFHTSCLPLQMFGWKLENVLILERNGIVVFLTNTTSFIIYQISQILKGYPLFVIQVNNTMFVLVGILKKVYFRPSKVPCIGKQDRKFK